MDTPDGTTISAGKSNEESQVTGLYGRSADDNNSTLGSKRDCAVFLMDRRSATILAADLVGYARLMSLDEEGVIRRLRAAYADIVSPTIESAGGRIVKKMGDGLLVEFASPVAAVDAAIQMQREMAAREACHPEDLRLRYRMGINSGNVVIDGEDLLGDAVNIAARLESLAPEGGILVSVSVHEQIVGKVDAQIVALGQRILKNIPQPVEVWRVDVAEMKGDPLANESKVYGVSLAVLPFEPLSEDPDHGFLADGIVEDVTSALSRFGSLFVIARNSAFAYRGSHRDMREIARALSVRYLVEGSLRVSGSRLRISVQLVDALTGGNVWSERWDKNIGDIFDLQEELSISIASAVAPRLIDEEIRHARNTRSPDFDTWRLCARALGRYYQFTAEDNLAAIEDFQSCAIMDPDFPLPRAYLSKALFTQVWLGWSAHPRNDIEEAESEARQALSKDPDLAEAHYALSCAMFWQAQLDAALRAIDRCLEINPNFADGHLVRSQVLSCLGRFAEAEEPARLALALSPTDPLRWAFLGNLADALFGAERWESALDVAVQACEASPKYSWGRLILAAAAVRAGRLEVASEALVRLENTGIDDLKELIAQYPFARDVDRERLASAIDEVSQQARK